MAVYDEIKQKARPVLKAQGLMDRRIRVEARALSTEEAIGNPEGDDFPLQQGKERLMQAELDGALGQAFTDRYGDFEGTLEEIFNMPLENNFRRAVFVATLNAALRSLGRADRTIHCRDQGPGLCSADLVRHIREQYGEVRIGQVGFQPAMVGALAEAFPMRVLDLDPDNIGTEKRGVTIEGADARKDVINWADLLLVTGTTLVNGTIKDFLQDTPVLFYGSTIAGAAAVMGWDRFCGQGT
ncbi:MAG: Rossmann-like domain-containing protein [Thermodesulfobacteriota bacterium]